MVMMALEDRWVADDLSGAVCRCECRLIRTPVGDFYAVAQWVDECDHPGVYLTYLKTHHPVVEGLEVRVPEVFAREQHVRKESRSLLDRVQVQLGEYFDGQRQSFELPLAVRGTGFQVSVWRGVYQVGYSHRSTYGELATRIGFPKGARAVGAALGKNPIWIVVPCHRVVGKSGSLVGFAGGLDCKRRLLELEMHAEIG